MKKLVALLLTTAVSFCLLAQQENSSDLVHVTKQGLIESQEVTYHSAPAVLQVDHYLIPISSNTQVKYRKEKGNHLVWFSLQKGTAVTSTKDEQWRRASFQLTFKSKQAALNFIRLFEEACAKN